MTPLTLGTLVMTPGAETTFATAYLQACLLRHQHGDWGNLDEEDREVNRDMLKYADGRILSEYGEGDKILWIITEGGGADRVTTFLLPSEY